MNNFVGGLVRAVVPILVGLLVTLGIRLGFHVDTTEATVVLTSLVTAAYTVFAHAVESVFPGLGKWLVTAGLFPKATEKAK
jgi:hypothetical protein